MLQCEKCDCINLKTEMVEGLEKLEDEIYVTVTCLKCGHTADAVYSFDSWESLSD